MRENIQSEHTFTFLFLNADIFTSRLGKEDTENTDTMLSRTVLFVTAMAAAAAVSVAGTTEMEDLLALHESFRVSSIRFHSSAESCYLELTVRTRCMS